MFIVLLTMVLCFVDCLQKKTKQQHSNLSKQQSTLKPKNFYDDHSSICQYKTLNILKPTIVTATMSSSSNSRSTSSIDSTTRANTAHNRAITSTYTYTALSTSEDLTPVDFDDNGVELMMTTV